MATDHIPRIHTALLCVLLAPLAAMPHRAAAQEEPSAHFLTLGAGFGSPSGITALGGLYFAPFAVRCSGGYWRSHWNGIQGDIGVLFNSGEEFAHGISVVAGFYRANPFLPDPNGAMQEEVKTERYVGAAYDAYLAGFFVQVGLARGRGDYPNPQLLLQCAYCFTL